jgi:plasmid stability protein
MHAVDSNASMCYHLLWVSYFGAKTMANLSIRKLDKKAYEQLRVRAAEHGVSMEEEARQIIYQTVSAPAQISRVFEKHFGYKNGVDLVIPNQRKPHEPMDFE